MSDLPVRPMELNADLPLPVRLKSVAAGVETLNLQKQSPRLPIVKHHCLLKYLDTCLRKASMWDRSFCIGTFCWLGGAPTSGCTPGKSSKEFILDISLPCGVRNIISSGYCQLASNVLANSSPFSARLFTSSMIMEVQTKLLLSQATTSRSESRPALKSVPLGQQLWSSVAPHETRAKIGRFRLRECVKT